MESRIRLAGLPLRFLRRDAAVLEPTQEVLTVEVDAPLAADDFGDTAAAWLSKMGGASLRRRSSSAAVPGGDRMIDGTQNLKAVQRIVNLTRK